MNDPAKVLRISVLAGAAYFIAIAAVHFVQVKVPGLYIYFDVPSTAYQDKIISFMALGWGMSFLMASSMMEKGLVKPFGYMLIAGVAALLSLSVINTSDELPDLAMEASLSIFWLETGGLLVYLVWLTYFYFQAVNSHKDKSNV